MSQYTHLINLLRDQENEVSYEVISELYEYSLTTGNGLSESDIAIIKENYNRDVFKDDRRRLLNEEHQQSLYDNREILEEYNEDVIGSSSRARQNAYSGSFSAYQDNDEHRAAFIQNTRSRANTTYENQLREERSKVNSKYDKNANHILDVPISYADDSINAVGAFIRDDDNTAHNMLAGATNSRFGVGKDGYLNKGLTSAENFKKEIANSELIRNGMNGIDAFRNAPDKLSKASEGLFKDSPHYGKVHRKVNKHLRMFTSDLMEILVEWWHDPRTLCCFIKNITAAAHSYFGKDTVWVDEKDELGNPVIDPETGKVVQKEVDTVKAILNGDYEYEGITKTREFFDKMIVILNLIKKFLQSSISFDLMLSLDLGLAISKASLSALVAILMSLQQMLQDQVYYKMLAWVEDNWHENWRQCFPIERLLRLIADWVTGPNGLFKDVERWVNGFLSEFSTGPKNFTSADKKKMIDITAIDKLINLLIWLRDAVLNYELCIEADFNGDEDLNDASDGSDTSDQSRGGSLTEPINAGLGTQGLNKPAGFGFNGGVVFPTDNEIHAFITNRMGESTEFADQVLATAKRVENSSPVTGSNNIGNESDLEHAIGDCARTINSNKIMDLAKLMSSWDLKV